MIISDFTKPEIEYFLENGNFVGNERDIFLMRSQGIPLEKIAEVICLSVDGVKKISRKINRKITRLL